MRKFSKKTLITHTEDLECAVRDLQEHIEDLADILYAPRLDKQDCHKAYFKINCLIIDEIMSLQENIGYNLPKLNKTKKRKKKL